MISSNTNRRQPVAHLLLLLSLVLSFFVGVPAAATASSSVVVEVEETQQHAHTNNKNLRSQHRSLTTSSSTMPSVAIYPMPPFRVSFASPTASTTTMSTSVNVNQDQDTTDIELLTLQTSLKLITSEFILESFRIQIANLDDDMIDNNKLYEMISQLITVNFAVTIRTTGNKEPIELVDGQQFTHYTVDFIGTASFPEPPPSINDQKPSNVQMYNILGDWIDWSFEQDMDVYQQYLLDSTTAPALQHHTMFQIDTNIDPSTIDEEGNQNSNPTQKRTAGEISIMVGLIVVAIITCFAIFGVVLPSCLRRRRRRRSSSTRYGGGSPSTPSTARSTGSRSFFNNNKASHLDADAVLPGRRADGQDETEYSSADEDDLSSPPVATNETTAAALNVIEASDRYLSKHRPDLFNAVQRASSSPPRGNGSGGNSGNGQQYQQHQIGLDLDGGYDSEYLDDEDYYYDEDGGDMIYSDSTVNWSWWNKLLYFSRYDIDNNRDGILVCDEDPSNYNFPFADFPRTDGTPCLIYDHHHNNNNTQNNDDAAVPLSNEEFQQQLSMQADGGGGEQKAADDYTDDDFAAGAETEPQFTERLERLVAMRRRHYEQSRRMERAKQARRQHKEREAQRQREIQLHRHEMELDIEEIEASVSPTATAVRRKIQHAASSSSGSNNNSNDNDLRLADSRHHKGHRMTLIDLGALPPGAEENVSLPPLSPPSLHVARQPRSTKPSLASSLSLPYDGSIRPPIPPSAAATITTTVQPGVVPKKQRRRGGGSHHRRSHSHGTNVALAAGMVEEKKVCDDYDVMTTSSNNGPSSSSTLKRHGSFTNADDVMTFGIAAYTTKFV